MASSVVVASLVSAALDLGFWDLVCATRLGAGVVGDGLNCRFALVLPTDGKCPANVWAWLLVWAILWLLRSCGKSSSSAPRECWVAGGSAGVSLSGTVSRLVGSASSRLSATASSSFSLSLLPKMSSSSSSASLDVSALPCCASVESDEMFLVGWLLVRRSCG